MVKQYKMEIGSLDKWIHQNMVNDEIEWVDAFDGCLIDNYFISCKHGLAILKEHYIDEWTSRHVLFFARFNNKNDILEIYDIWEDLKRFNHE